VCACVCVCVCVCVCWCVSSHPVYDLLDGVQANDARVLLFGPSVAWLALCGTHAHTNTHTRKHTRKQTHAQTHTQTHAQTHAHTHVLILTPLSDAFPSHLCEPCTCTPPHPHPHPRRATGSWGGEEGVGVHVSGSQRVGRWRRLWRVSGSLMHGLT